MGVHAYWLRLRGCLTGHSRLCVQGRNALYAYCDGHGVPYWRCGKLIVASDPHQVPILRDLAQNAAASGVANLQ